MYKYTQMAEEVRGSFDGKDIDGHIAKYASDKSLNMNQQQRLVEEVNVGSFLDRLKDGTQHEDFPVASAIQASNVPHELDKTASWGDSGDAPLEKVASENMAHLVDDSMFHLNMVEFDDTAATEVLAKTAGMYDVNLDAAQEGWDEGQDLVKEASAKRLEETETLAKGDLVGECIDTLTKIASHSDGQAKAVIVLMAKMDLEKEAEDVIQDVKFSTSEIAEAIASKVPEEAVSEIMKLADAKSTAKDAEGVAKEVYRSGKHAGNAALGLVKFPFKNPKTAAAGALAALAAKRLADNETAENAQLEMSNYATGAN